MKPAVLPRIALIHALEESVAPARLSFAQDWPEAVIFDLLDTSLARDLAAAGKLEPEMMARFATLGDYAAQSRGEGGETQAILFTCSAFGPAIDAVKDRLAIPVLRPNEAGFEDALAAGSRIGLIVSFGPSLPALSQELQTMAAARGQEIALQAVLADGALAALKAGDGAGHDAAIAQAARQLDGVDVILLGQFSMARAARAVAKVCSCPVITTPNAAVAKLHRLLNFDQ